MAESTTGTEVQGRATLDSRIEFDASEVRACCRPSRPTSINALHRKRYHSTATVRRGHELGIPVSIACDCAQRPQVARSVGFGRIRLGGRAVGHQEEELDLDIRADVVV